MIRVLGVADPAVLTYADENKQIRSRRRKKSGVEVEFSILPRAEYCSAQTDTLESDAGSYPSACGIVMVAGHLWLQDFINCGFLQPLTGIREAGAEYAPYPGVLSKEGEETEAEGTPWLVPSFTEGHTVFYKKDNIAKVICGELPEALSPTAYLELGKKIGSHKAGTGRRFAAVKADPNEIFPDWLPWFDGTGANLLGGDLTPLFNTPAGVELTGQIRDFLVYLVSPEIGAGAGSPVRQSSYENAGSRQPRYPVQRKMASLARSLPVFTGSGEIFGCFHKWIAAAWAGEATPETALSEPEKETTEE